MGQEISQQNKCSNIRRQQAEQQNYKEQNFKPTRQQQIYLNCNEKYMKHKNLIYTSSNISTTSSSTDEEPHYRQRQKYNLSKQTYEKTKVSKKFSLLSSTTTASTTSVTTNSTSDYQTTPVSSPRHSDNSIYEKYAQSTAIYSAIQQPQQLHKQHQRKNSQSTDSGIYYSSCHCNSTSSTSILSSAASTTSGCSSSVLSQRSNKSLDKQKQYLNNHLYIKSYLDILEEDEKARVQFKSARPGGIRNYTPKILSETTALSSSAPVARGSAKSKEDPWI